MSEWSNFVKGKMGPYMKKYGGHAGAMKQLSKEWNIKKKKSMKKPIIKKKKIIRRKRVSFLARR